MAITNIKEDIKDVMARISGMCFKIESVLSLCLDGFVKHKGSLIDEARKISQAVCCEENELVKMLTSKGTAPGPDKELIKCAIAVIGHIEMAVNGLNSVLHHAGAKVSEGIPFSDKAMNEITHLLKESFGVARTAGDVFLTKNEVLKKYIIDKCINLNQIVDAYAEEHEERLIKGLCQPQSSLVYLNIVNSLMNVVWPIKRAVDRFFITR